jgi:hypothetical protein
MATEELSLNEKIELCIKLSDIGAARWNRRRDVEWKITLGFWAAILATAKFLHEASVPVKGCWAYGVAAALLLVVYALVWLRGMWAANESDKKWEFHFRRAAALFLEGEQLRNLMLPDKTERPPILCWPWQDARAWPSGWDHSQTVEASKHRQDACAWRTLCRDWSPLCCDWSILFQFLVTLILLVMCVILVFSKTTRPTLHTAKTATISASVPTKLGKTISFVVVHERSHSEAARLHAQRGDWRMHQKVS